MTASAVTTGYGSLIALSDGAASPDTVYVALAEIVSIQGPNLSREPIDVTHLLSDDQAKEFIGGLADGGDVTLNANFLPQDSTQQDLLDNLFEQTAADVVRGYRICWTDFGASSFTGTVNSGTEIWTTSAHGWLTGQPVRFTNAGGALPASTPQIVAGKTYYLKVLTTTTFTVHLTPAAAAAGSGAIDFTGTGTGTHTVHGASEWRFNALTTGFNPSATKDDRVQAELRLKITGKPTFLP